MRFDTFLHLLPSNPLVEAIKALYEASEGDARKYMKKMLQSMGLEQELAEDYGENWSEAVFNKIRDSFVHQGCDVYFVPGIARIAYGELDFDSDDEDTQKIANLKRLVKFITMAHKGQFTRNLERISVIQEGPQKGMKVKSKPMTYEQLANMFSNEAKSATANEREEYTKNNQSGDNGYKIIELKDFEQAHKLLPYCTADPWCYLENEYTFDTYAQSGNKLYVALAPGFEKLKPGDPGYGRSMIGFDMGPVDENGKSELCVCNNRYNHAKNLEHEEGVGTGDDAYNEIQLSKILGFPVWEKCPGYTEEELAGLGRITPVYVKKLVKDVDTITQLLSDEGKATQFAEQYHLRIHQSDVMDNAVEFFSNDHYYTPVICALATKDGLVWYKSADTLSLDRCDVMLQDNKHIFVSSEGVILNKQQFDDIDSYKGVYPITVSMRSEGSRKYQVNYIDHEGQLVSPIWFDSGTTFYRQRSIAEVSKDKKINIMLPSGKLVFDTWFDFVECKHSNAPYYIVSNDASSDDYSTAIYDKNFNLVISGLKSAKETGSTVLIENRESKYNVYDAESCKILFDQWFDSINSLRFCAANGSYCYYVYDAEKGYNIFNTRTGKPMLPAWSQKMDYIGQGFYLVAKDGKINLYDPYENEFILPTMCDEHDSRPVVHEFFYGDDADDPNVYVYDEENTQPLVYPGLARDTAKAPTKDPILIDNLYLNGKPVIFFHHTLIDATKYAPYRKEH